MKNTNTNEMSSKIKSYLLPIIEQKAESYEVEQPSKPFSWILETAKAEIPHEFKRHGEQRGLCEWLQGLGMNLDYMNHSIIELAETWHECKLTEKEKDLVCENWFNFIAVKICQYARKEK